MTDLITATWLRAIPTTDEVARVYFQQAADALDAKDRQIAWHQRLREALRDHTVRDMAASEAARDRAQAALRCAEDRERVALDEITRLTAEVERLRAGADGGERGGGGAA